MNRATLLLHGGRAPGVAGDPVVTPLSPSVNYMMSPGGNGDVKYARYGNTPTADALHRRLAALEGADSALVLSSGMGATTCTLLALLRAGDHVVASAWLYGDTRRFLEIELPTMGIDVTFIDPTETRAWRRAMRLNTRVLFLESPVNPSMRVVDLRPARMLAQEQGVALVVDSTFATPINYRPLEHRADVVLHSATKYLNGHHDVLAGVVCGAESVIEEVRAKMAIWGQAPDPFAVWLLERGLKTLDVRVQRQNASALQIAQWASGVSSIRAVHYPGLPSHPDHEIARAMFDGYGGMLAIELTGGDEAAARVVSRLALFTHAPSLGGVESLVSEPRYTSHRQLDSEARAAMGIPSGFLRLSVGLEGVDDLIADLTQALES
ncbi:MAG: aminotransferase class I/II-fold pyridoxal phosphate-dependent enzyme [Gemmatimonadaceae bacterium]|nr:aminotransferase class I/II-fold pyridoxal phosphate-dependent enzyme [Gemmatimonadaceae bacterium]